MSIRNSGAGFKPGSGPGASPPAEKPSPCPRCTDTRIWILTTDRTAYLPACPWCDDVDFPDDPQPDFHDADAVAQPTPLEGGEGGGP